MCWRVVRVPATPEQVGRSARAEQQGEEKERGQFPKANFNFVFFLSWKGRCVI